MDTNYFVGKPILFTINNAPAEFGEIFEIKETSQGARYVVRRPADKPSPDGWEYFTICDNQILKTEFEKTKPIWEPWALEHKQKIIETFDREINDYTCIIVYDSLDNMSEDGFADFIGDEQCCRQVLDKWVFIVN